MLPFQPLQYEVARRSQQERLAKAEEERRAALACPAHRPLDAMRRAVGEALLYVGARLRGSRPIAPVDTPRRVLG
jgi:hypothetical protein